LTAITKLDLDICELRNLGLLYFLNLQDEKETAGVYGRVTVYEEKLFNPQVMVEDGM
jgi:hypothetical protein